MSDHRPSGGGIGSGGNSSGGWSLRSLAETVGGTILGDADRVVHGVRTLDAAESTDLSFVAQATYRDQATASGAGALLVPKAMVDGDTEGDLTLDGLTLDGQRPLWWVEGDVMLALARLLPILHPPRVEPPGVHPTAVVDPGAAVDPSAHLGPYVVVGEGSRIGPHAVLQAHVVVGCRCSIGAGAVLHPHAVLYDDTAVGDHSILHAGVVLGADGFGYTPHEGQHVKVPQVGRTVLEESVEVGANSAIDRALLEETRIGAGTKIDNLVQVGHNVTTGRGCILCGQVGVAGSARLGDYVVMGGQSGAAGHLDLESGVQVAAKSAVLQSVPAGKKVGGIPAIDLGRWRRQAMMSARLGELARRLRAVEKALEERTDDEGG